jgi:hypothetical protein
MDIDLNLEEYILKDHAFLKFFIQRDLIVYIRILNVDNYRSSHHHYQKINLFLIL